MFLEQWKVELMDQDDISTIMKMLSGAKRCDMRMGELPLLRFDFSFYTNCEDDEIIGPYYIYHLGVGKKAGYYILVGDDEFYKISDEDGKYIWYTVKGLIE